MVRTVYWVFHELLIGTKTQRPLEEGGKNVHLYSIHDIYNAPNDPKQSSSKKACVLVWLEKLMVTIRSERRSKCL